MNFDHLNGYYDKITPIEMPEFIYERKTYAEIMNYVIEVDDMIVENLAKACSIVEENLVVTKIAVKKIWVNCSKFESSYKKKERHFQMMWKEEKRRDVVNKIY
jgi:hypothetical protein